MEPTLPVSQPTSLRRFSPLRWLVLVLSIALVWCGYLYYASSQHLRSLAADASSLKSSYQAAVETQLQPLTESMTSTGTLANDIRTSYGRVTAVMQAQPRSTDLADQVAWITAVQKAVHVFFDAVSREHAYDGDARVKAARSFFYDPLSPLGQAITAYNQKVVLWNNRSVTARGRFQRMLGSDEIPLLNTDGTMEFRTTINL